jgi:hypothetical protein
LLLAKDLNQSKIASYLHLILAQGLHEFIYHGLFVLQLLREVCPQDSLRRYVSGAGCTTLNRDPTVCDLLIICNFPRELADLRSLSETI